MELNSKSIEVWCEQFDKFPRNKVMSDSSAESVITLMFNPEMDKDTSLRTKMADIYSTGVILSGLSKFDYKMTNRAILFLSMNVKSPGDIVMYLTYLQWKCFKSKIKLVTLKYLMTEIFPWGFVSDDNLNKA